MATKQAPKFKIPEGVKQPRVDIGTDDYKGSIELNVQNSGDIKIADMVKKLNALIQAEIANRRATGQKWRQLSAIAFNVRQAARNADKLGATDFKPRVIVSRF